MVKPEGNKRISKVDAYLNCAENFAYRSTCIKRKYGAVIVKDITVRPEDLRTAATLENAPESDFICIRGRDMRFAGQYMRRQMLC